MSNPTGHKCQLSFSGSTRPLGSGERQPVSDETRVDDAAVVRAVDDEGAGIVLVNLSRFYFFCIIPNVLTYLLTDFPRPGLLRVPHAQMCG